MSVVSAQNVTVDFGGKVLFENVSFDVYENESVGLIGANGTGKTTIFKLITNQLEPSSGGVFISKNSRIGYLEQHACAGSRLSAYDEVLTVFDEVMRIEAELDEIAGAITDKIGDRDAHILRQNELYAKFEDMGGLTYKSRARAALLGLGFEERDFYLPCDKLSGGQRSKLSMAKLLLSGADLLLLDEPTNHLDIAATEWLESFLQSFKGAALIISHDRYFLDKVTNKTMELSNGRLHCAKGGYSRYLELKEERLKTERRAYENQLAEIKRIEGIIEQQKAFGRERNFITIESKRKMLEKKKAELVVPERDPASLYIKFQPVAETGNEVLNVLSLSKGFGVKQLFTNVQMQVRKSDRAFVIGPNGCGKTTLLRILVKQQDADSGAFSFGANVKVGYFDQSLESLNHGKTVIDEIWDEHRSFTETTVRSYLALFLFRGDDVYKSVDNLSGGEKAKLCLLKLMLSGANVLLLDEPTNHLDIPSREALEVALSNFDGTILAVSHDRFFINKLATKIFRMGKESVEKFDGDYDTYMALTLSAQQNNVKKASPKVNLYKQRKERESEIKRLEGKILRGEKRIDELENEISQVNERMSTPEVSADYELVLELTSKVEQLNTELEHLMLEWEEWQERLEELRAE